MILIGAMLFAVVAALLTVATMLKFQLGLTFRQAVLYAPLKLVYRVIDDRISIARKAEAPVIYVISHQSKLDPALMLSLLPADTLHILDDYSARSLWLEPWRELARTIPFNAEHVFVSRRLVRHLRGRGKLAVYLPDDIEPDVKTFRLFRAVARIAVKAEARIVPILVGGARHLPSSLTPAARAPRRRFPELKISVLEPNTIAELQNGAVEQGRPSNALFDRVAEVRFASADLSRTLFLSIRDAAKRFGFSQTILEDVVAGTMSYRRLFIEARVLARRFSDIDQPGEAVGLMLPNANAAAVSFLALQSVGRVAAMINYTSGAANVASAIRAATIRTVIASRALVEKANLQEVIAAIEKAGARIVWMEDLAASITTAEKALGFLFWYWPIALQDAEKPAAILFTSGSEGTPKGVALSHRNVVANTMQSGARVAFSPEDKLLNVLPVFHSFGLTCGTILPLLAGVRTFLYPSPLHYKLIPEVAATARPTILVGTSTFLSGYAKTAKDADFASIRLVVAGAEAVRDETRRSWRERFGAEIVEGFGITEASPVVAVNSSTHNREGTVGRLLPGMRMKIEPVEGIPDGGRLHLAGTNIMMGYMTEDRPGALQPLASEWYDTGDIVSVDRDGFITIRGRARRFAKIAGEMVSLGAVEMLVHDLWPEQHHAVVAVPDKRKGERIVLVTTAVEAEAKRIRQFSRKAGASALMVPDTIVKVEEIPVLGSGKTDYAVARQMAVERLGLDAAA